MDPFVKNDDNLKLFLDATSLENLMEISVAEAAKSVARGRDGLTPSQFLGTSRNHVQQLSSKMQSGSYSPISFRQFLKSRGPNREPRLVSVPAARDRVALKALAKYLHQTVPASRGERPQAKISRLTKDIDRNLFRHFIRIDVKNFYLSISHNSVDNAIDQHDLAIQACQLLKKSIRTPTLGTSGHGRDSANTVGIPQGLPISNALAELVLVNTDATFEGRNDIAYYRYVDDILILTKRPSHRKIFSEISNSLKPLGLTCHPLQKEDSKSTWGPLSEAIDFLGYSISESSVSVRKSSVNRLKSKIALLLAQYKKSLLERPPAIKKSEWLLECTKRLQWYLNITISGCILDQRRRGWINYFSLINDFSLLRNLDYFVERKLSDYGLSNKISAKTFIESYRWAAKISNKKSGVLENFDDYNNDQKVHVLSLIFRIPTNYLETLDDDQISVLFLRKVRKELELLEVDLSLVY